MNLYGPTEKRNREMGVLIRKFADYRNESDIHTFYDALQEIKEIIGTASIEKESVRAASNKFSYQILNSKKALIEPYLDEIKTVFKNKVFRVVEDSFDLPEIVSSPFYENTNVYLQYDLDVNERPEILLRRIAIEYDRPEALQEGLFKAFHQEFERVKGHFEHYQVYWNYHKSYMTIYPIKSKFPNWENARFQDQILMLKPALDDMIDYIKYLEKKYRIY
jgi:hypothetical protein